MLKELSTKFWAVALAILAISIAGCSENGNYRKLVDRELGTNIRNDTLLHGIRFGMNKREFFAHCWELNKKGLYKEGAGNTTVFFEMDMNDKKYHVNFYPKFSNGRITELPVEYTYPAFAPWNPEYSLELLQKEIVDYYIEQYGTDYLEIASKKTDHGVAYVWIDGNRRISIYKNILRNSVTALYFDLSSEKSMEVAPVDTDL